MTHAPVSLRLALALLVATVGVGAATQAGSDEVVGRPEIEVFAPDAEFAPGQTVSLRLFLTNRGDILSGGPAEFEERVTTARGTTVELLDGGVPFEVDTGRLPVGTVPTGTSGPFVVNLTIPEDAPPGRYRVPVDLEYTYTRSVEYFPTRPTLRPRFTEFDTQRRATVVVEVTEDAQFEVVGTESDVLVGDNGTLTLSVRNTGSETVTGASVRVESPGDELLFGTRSGSAEGFVGTWRPGETKQVPYRVTVAEDAKARNYTVRATVDYTDPDGIRRRSEELAALVRPGGEQAFALRDVESTLRVGQEGTVTGTVVNEGPATAYSPVLAFRSDNPNFFVAESEYALPTLSPGESASFSFDVEVSDDTDPGPRQVALDVGYRNAEDERRQAEPLDARVAVEPRRDAFVVRPVTENLTAGSSAAFRFEVTNNRNETLRDVSARVFVDDPLSSADEEAYVPELAPGESAELVVRLSASGDALPKTYPVSVDFEYETADGDTELSKTYRVPLAVRPREGGGLPFVGGRAPVVGAAAALLVGLLAAAWFARR